jgi:hypothetical protein
VVNLSPQNVELGPLLRKIVPQLSDCGIVQRQYIFETEASAWGFDGVV